MENRRPGIGKGLMVKPKPTADDSGARHTRTRGVNASARRRREAERQQETLAERFEDFTGREVDLDVGLDSSEDTDDMTASEPVEATRVVVCKFRKGRDGRFVSSGSGSTSGSSRRSGNVADDSWIVRDRVPEGPIDRSVIPSFLGHVAHQMWSGNMRGILRCQNRVAVCERLRQWYQRMQQHCPKAQSIVDQTGLSHLQATMFSHIDAPLLSAFVERWQPDTNSFHLPFREMTIMLHDVWEILRIPVEGKMVSVEPNTSEEQAGFMELLGMSRDVLVQTHWGHGGVMNDVVFRHCERGFDEQQATGWMLLLLANTLFVDKSGNRVKGSFLSELGDSCEGVESYSWGSAALAYLYRQLGIASRGDCSGLSGCLTLLQAWIYEYFLCFRPHRDRMIVDGTVPRAVTWSTSVFDRADIRLCSIRSRLDQLTPAEVAWLPYGANPASTVPRTVYNGWVRYRDIIEPYMPGRVVRQLGYVQGIPAIIHRPLSANRSWECKHYKVRFLPQMVDDAWCQFPEGYCLSVTQYRSVSTHGESVDDRYMQWYYSYSHPRLLSSDIPEEQGLPSRTNSEYRVSRLADITQSGFAMIPSQSARPHLERLERFLEDWRSAN